MPAQITANEKNLVKVFNDDYIFDIPRYQRPYAWGREQVDDLMDDLLGAMERDPEEPYFLGSVVIIKRDGESESQVVDGQQRLTTLTMLLCVLRELSNGKDAEQLDKFIREAGNFYSGTKDRFRISLRERDRMFFQEKVQTLGGLESFLLEDSVRFSDSQRLIQGNANHLKGILSKLSDTKRREFATYVIQNCYLVVVSASDRGSAHRIFSVMNERGLDLEATDILKAEIIGDIPSESEDAYTATWEEIEVDLGRGDFRNLFAHIRMIYRKEKQRRGTLEDEFRASVLNRHNAQEFVDDVLEPYADVYKEVSRGEYQSSDDAQRVNGLLRHLRHLDNFDWIPPAMAFSHRHRGNHPSILSFTQDLERLGYGMFIRRTSLNDRISRYARLLSSIEEGADLFAESSPLQLTSDEKADILTRLDGDIYGQSRIPMPLLMRLNSLLYDGEPPDNLPWATSIEHVLPQSPSADWLRLFPDEEERARWTHRLANLVVLSRRKNARASNWDFQRKKQEYFLRNGTTPFALTTQVVAQDEWTPAVLERRQKWLLDTLKKEWRLG